MPEFLQQKTQYTRVCSYSMEKDRFYSILVKRKKNHHKPMNFKYVLPKLQHSLSNRNATAKL